MDDMICNGSVQKFEITEWSLNKKNTSNEGFEDRSIFLYKLLEVPLKASIGLSQEAGYKFCVSGGLWAGARTAGSSHPVEVCVHGPLLDPELSSKGGKLLNESSPCRPCRGCF